MKKASDKNLLGTHFGSLDAMSAEKQHHGRSFSLPVQSEAPSLPPNEETEICFLIDTPPDSSEGESLQDDPIKIAMRLSLLAHEATTLCDLYREKSPSLPSSLDPIQYVIHAFCVISETLKDYLAAKRPNKKVKVPAQKAVAIASTVSSLSTELVNLSTRGGKEIEKAMRRSETWPATISIDTSQNVALSLKTSHPPSVKKHRSIHLALGKDLPLETRARKNGVFYKIARELSFSILQNLCFAGPDRSKGLPWLLDYISSDGTLRRIREYTQFEDVKQGKVIIGRPFHYEPTISVSADEQKEMLAALYYYIHLTLSPMEQRDHIQNEWRRIREELFLQKNTVDPGPTLENWVSQSYKADPSLLHLRSRHIRSLVKGHDPNTWHATYLSSSLTDIFGTSLPITDWDDPQIRMMKDKWTKYKKPKNPFTACVKEILKAYINLSTETKPIPPSPIKEPKKVGRKKTGAKDFSLADIKNFSAVTDFSKIGRHLSLEELCHKFRPQ